MFPLPTLYPSAIQKFTRTMGVSIHLLLFIPVLYSSCFLIFFLFFFLMLSISFSLCLSFQCAVSIAFKCTFETQQDHGPFPRAINEIILSRNLTFCFSWRFRFTKPFVRCRCILFFYTTISERRYVGKLLTFVKNVKRLENTTARERHTGSIETFFVRTILS